MKPYFFVYCGAEFASWYSAERTWLSALVKLLYNRYQRQKSPSCVTQLGDRFIPHKYYRQIRNTRKQRTQEWRKVSFFLNNVLKSIRKCYKKYYFGLWEQEWQNSTISVSIPVFFLSLKMAFLTLAFLQDDLYHGCSHKSRGILKNILRPDNHTASKQILRR